MFCSKPSHRIPFEDEGFIRCVQYSSLSERGEKINCKKENSDFRCSPKVWFERRAAAAENAAVSAVLEEVKGITESLNMSSKEEDEDKVIEENVIEGKEGEEEEERENDGDAGGIILSAYNLKAMLEPEPLLMSNGGHRVSRAEPETLMGRKEEEVEEEVAGRGGYFVRGVEGVQTLV